MPSEMEIESQLAGIAEFLPDVRDQSVSAFTANVILQTIDDSSQQEFSVSSDFTSESPASTLSSDSKIHCGNRK